MKLRRFAIVATVAALLLSPFNGVQACGPIDEPDTFVRMDSPDNLGTFALGHLGILQRGYDSNEYAVAYRYLNGGKLSDEQRLSYAPPPGPPIILNAEQWKAAQQARQDAQPPKAWLLNRAKYLPGSVQGAQEQSFPTDFQGLIVFDPSYLNCPDPAFQNAVLTLNKRADSWGKQSPWLMDWIHGQDAVFSNCTGKSPATPSPVPADSPALLRADRAYQLASAAFYAKQYDQAAQQFAAIARDKSSPWNSWGEYLTARAIVRKAFAMGKPTEPYSSDVADFDLGTMQSVQKMLEALLAQRNPLPSREIVLKELNFVRIRTEPEKRITEICAALAGPGPDANFFWDLDDLSYVLMKHIAIGNPPPLYAWIAAFRTSGGAGAAFATWQQNHALPWLVMAIIKADPSDAFVSQLLAEAEKIKPGSPAYDTVFYHRVRLLIGLNRADEVRSLLDQALPAMRSQPPSSNENALLAERLAVARDFKEFLVYAPRKVVVSSEISDAAIQANCVDAPAEDHRPDYCPQKGGPPRLDHSLEFDDDAVYILNRQTPINLLVEAASSPSLPANLRQDLVLATWTRSVVLQDAISAAKLAPLLPKSIRETADTGVGFTATLAILRNPGLRPYLEPGVSRLASFNQLDNYRNNWWGDNWERKEPLESYQLQRSAALTKQQQANGDAEYQRLLLLPPAAALLGQRIIEYAKEHPADPEVPEALALTVRATRYPSTDWKAYTTAAAEDSAISKAAFQLLHSRYPKSPWAIKTRFYY